MEMGLMCDKSAYREPEPKESLLERSPVNPKNRKKKESTGTEFQEDYIR